jgi:beta-mannanase
MKNFTPGNALFVLVVFLSINPPLALAAKGLPRVNFGSRLEPVGDQILHGAGQVDTYSFTTYSSAVPKTQPAVFMTYWMLADARASMGSELKAQLESISTSKMIIPQIGLSMTVDGEPKKHYEHLVATDKYDKQIQAVCQALKNLGRPAFVRIGYEFNGSWNGYQPTTYKLAFQKIVKAIRAAGLNEVAIIWNYSLDQPDVSFDPYYPGDSSVDWWGISMFGESTFSNPLGEKFLKEAEQHKKPVMIGEATPRKVGVKEGLQSWNRWFEPFFKYIAVHPVIKEFSYINWNWSAYPQWSDWGDARIQTNNDIAKKYANEIEQNPQFLNQIDGNKLRRALGLHSAGM